MSANVSPISPAFDVNQLKGWLPVDAVVRNGRPGLEWMDMNEVELREPLFHQTVSRVREERADQQECFTEFEILIRFEKAFTGLPPTGFIFHSSRCGSTVVANACKALDNTLAVSEANAIDKLVARFFTEGSADRTRELLYSVFVRGAVNALGQARTGSETRYFVKYSCTSVLQLARIRRIFPDVPWVFVYRDPVEVIVSNLENPPDWMKIESNRIMAAAFSGASDDEIDLMSPEEFCARVVGRFYASAADLVDSSSVLLNYEDLSLDRLSSVIKFFGVTPTAHEREALRQVLSVYGKDANLQRPFSVDSQAKQASASDAVRAMAERWAIQPYNRLEEIRSKQKLPT
jgi:hypothetical protein